MGIRLVLVLKATNFTTIDLAHARRIEAIKKISHNETALYEVIWADSLHLII